jgi:hypothetical protein
MSLRSKIATSILLAIAGILVIFGIGDIQQGPAADPAITTAISGQAPADVKAAEPTGYRLYDFAIRMGGLNLVLIGLLLASIATVPYRLGSRWAWNTMWLVPAWSLAVPVLFVAYGSAPGTPLPPPAISGPILAGIAGTALLVDRGRFVGRRVADVSLGVEPA